MATGSVVGVGELAGQHRRDRGLGGGRHRGGVPVPGRAGRQVGEGREPGGVDRPLTVEKRPQGQLVEDDQHDGRRVADRHVGRLDPAARDEVAHGGREQEEGEEHGQGEGQVPEHRAHRPGPEREDPDQHGHGPAEEQQTGAGVPAESRLRRGHGVHPDTRPEQPGVDAVPVPTTAEAERLLHQPEDQCGAQTDEEGVRHDQRPRPHPRDEGVGGVLDDVEDGLGDDDGGQADELGQVHPLPGHGGRAGRLGAVGR